MILDPTGTVISGVISENEGIVYADIDVAACVEPKQFHDVVGYDNRFDIFSLNVDRRPLGPAAFNDVMPEGSEAASKLVHDAALHLIPSPQRDAAE